MKKFYIANPKAKIEAADFEKFIEQFKNQKQSKAPDSYTVPVVFHVFGTAFNGGSTVTDEIIKNALKTTNEDFQGLTADWNTVDSDFVPVRKALNVTFKLANLDPNGNPTTGIRYYPVKSGFGDIGTTIENEIRKYAWDNYKYCNIYIMQDLYDDGKVTNSGVAWYPNKWMSDNNIARIVYNGSYLGTNTNENFRSVLTHEFGHYLDLRHTFLGGCPDNSGCSTSGDLICDTPPADKPQLNGALNCEGKKTNWQNFMDYSNNYAMFTIDQVTRMQAAMEHVSRKPLWQQTNLQDTGLNGPIGPNIVYSSIVFQEHYTNDGGTNTELTVQAREGVRFTITNNNEFQQNVHYTVSNVPTGLSVKIVNVQENSLKVKLSGKASNHNEVDYVNNLGITFTNAAFSSHSASQVKGVAMQNLMIEYQDPYEFKYGVLDNKEEIIVDGNGWSYFELEDIKSINGYYGLKWDNSLGDERLKLEVSTKGSVIVTDVRDIVPLTEGTTIGPNANWANRSDLNGGQYSPVLVRDGYNAWKGKVAYAGISFSVQGRPLSYGWIRLLVSEDGTRARAIDYAFKEEPGVSIKAGETPGALLSSDKLVVYENENNNGTIGDHIEFMLLGNESFKNSTTLNQGTHYSISGLPEGLTTQIVRNGDKKVTLNINGSATSHLDGDSRKITISFKNAAFQGNDINQVKHTDFSVEVRFLNPYSIIHRKYHSPEVVSSSKILGWNYLETEEDEFWAYGLRFFENSLKIRASGKSFIMNNTTYELTPLTEGTVIGESSNFYTSYYWPGGYPVLSSPSYTTLNGKASYVGIRLKDPAGRTHYGWIKYEISSNGKSGKLLEAAYNTEPNKSIKAGETGPDIPCHSGSKLGRSQHLSAFTLGSFTQSCNIPKSYTDYTTKTIKVRPGIKYPLSVTHSFKDINNYHWFRVWIDLNKDNDFDDNGEFVYYASQTFKGEHSGEINIPNVSGTYRMRITLKNSFGDAPAPSPCEYYDFGETEEYTINISSSNPLHPSASFTASGTEIIEKDTVKFTDQSTHNPTSWNWTFPGGIPSSSTEQHPVIKYDTAGTYDVTLTVSNTDGSHTLTKEKHITVTNAPDAYCVPKHTNPSNRYIKSVKLETINNTTGQGVSNGYSDYTNINTTLEAGRSYTLDAQPSNIAWATYAQNRMVAWIDFSKNNSFSSSEMVSRIVATEEMENSDVYPTSQITIPANTPPGTYRLRIRHVWESNDDPEYSCSEEGEGETEDYSIIVTNTQTPTPPTNLTSSNITQTSADLNWGASTVSGGGTISYDIYNGDSKIGSASTTQYTVTGLTSNTTYTFTVKAKSANANESEASNAHTLTTLKPDASYCAAQSTNSNYESISRIQFGSIDQASGSTGYGNYVALKTDLVKGQTTSLAITTKGNYPTDELVVYIDYNRDGDFEDHGEEVYHHNNASTASTYRGNVVPPNTASPGDARMRIILFDINYDNKTSCGDFRYGEVEDYTVTIVDSKNGTNLFSAESIYLYPNPTKNKFTIQSVETGSMVNIINITGQIMKTKKVSSDAIIIDMAGFAPGLYMVQIKTDQEVITKYIVKE